MSDDAREAALAHFGVKGMKWGVRKARKNTPGGRSSETSSSGAKNGKKVEVPKQNKNLTAEQKAKALARRQLGKQVAIAVVASAGGIAAASFGGPLVGAAASAAIRESSKLFETQTTVNSITLNSGGELVKDFKPYSTSGKTDVYGVSVVKERN